MEKKKHVVVVGNGMTSIRFCEQMLEYDALHEYRLTVLGEEPLPAYDRVALSSCFSGKSTKDLIFAEARWYAHCKIDLRLGTRVTNINRADQSVTTAEGSTISYDRLVLATGARPHIPKIGNTNLNGVFVYRTSADVDSICAAAQQAKRAVVIGGGLLGLEAAEACLELGLETTIIERAAHLMTCQLDAKGGQFLREKVEALNLNVRTGEQVHGIEGRDAVEAVQLKKESIPADLVILATGIQPNDELGSEAGLAIGAKGGIAISETVRTSDPNIYAIGECTSFNDSTFGLVAPGYAMAEAAAAHLGGINKTFQPGAPASRLKLLDLQVASIGTPLLAEPDAHCIVNLDTECGVYKKLITDSDARYLLGAILVGETSEFSQLQKALEEKIELPEHPETLLAPIGEPFEPELEMEDDDVVCFCNYVTKADICRAIDRDNLKSTGDVMGTTYAAGVCGSCLDLVDTVTQQHLARHTG